MDDMLAFQERYLLRLIYYRASGHSSEMSDVFGENVSYDTHTAIVRVLNTGDRPLSLSNLECLSHSIPKLNQRIIGNPQPPQLLYPALLQVASVSLNSCPTFKPTRQQSQKIHPRTHASNDAQLVTQHAKSAPSPAERHLHEDWLKCDGSYVPFVKDNDWTTVKFRNNEFMRCISPVCCTDDAGDLIGRCSVSDYTAYGQPVFSVHMDFLSEEGVTGSDLIKITKSQQTETRNT